MAAAAALVDGKQSTATFSFCVTGLSASSVVCSDSVVALCSLVPLSSFSSGASCLVSSVLEGAF